MLERHNIISIHLKHTDANGLQALASQLPRTVG
jgi:hypothetical protein